MLQFNDKPLENLSMEESIEFEKMVLKKVLAANSAGMSNQVIEQLNGYLSIIRSHKQEKINQFVSDATEKNEPKHSGGLDIGEIESEQSDDIDGE